MLSEKHQQAATHVLQALEGLRLFSVVQEVLKSHASPSELADAALVSSMSHSCSISQKLTRSHYVAMLLLLWPYPNEPENSHGCRMRKLVGSLFESCSSNGIELLRTEVEQLRCQLESVLGYVRKCSGCRCQRKLMSDSSRPAAKNTT